VVADRGALTDAFMTSLKTKRPAACGGEARQQAPRKSRPARGGLPRTPGGLQPQNKCPWPRHHPRKDRGHSPAQSPSAQRRPLRLKFVRGGGGDFNSFKQIPRNLTGIWPVPRHLCTILGGGLQWAQRKTSVASVRATAVITVIVSPVF
jgi:hypothetical protein